MNEFYAVIDTNVIVSAFLKSGSIPDKILRHALTGSIIPLLNDEIIEEYRDVLLRNQFGFDRKTIEIFINELSKRGIFLDREKTDEEFFDLDDIVFYEIVLSARNTIFAYLITGNKRHFPFKPFVVTPREMLNIIEHN